MFAALVAGCGGAPITVQTAVTQPPADVLRAHKALMIHGAGSKPEWEAEGRKIASLTAHRLEGHPYFSAVIDAQAAGADKRIPEVDVVIRVMEMKSVTREERENLGKSAGETRIDVRLEITDHASHAVLGAAAFDCKGYEGPSNGTNADCEEQIRSSAIAFITGSPRQE